MTGTTICQRTGTLNISINILKPKSGQGSGPGFPPDSKRVQPGEKKQKIPKT